MSKQAVKLFYQSQMTSNYKMEEQRFKEIMKKHQAIESHRKHETSQILEIQET